MYEVITFTYLNYALSVLEARAHIHNHTLAHTHKLFSLSVYCPFSKLWKFYLLYVYLQNLTFLLLTSVL